MKKALLIASRVLFAVVLAFCIFKTCSILADTSIFQITKIEVKDKSEGVVVNSVGLSEGQLQNDIIFSAKDDYIKYNITIKNTSNDDYTIKSITDNNDSTNLEYTYEDLTNVVVESKTEKTFELQIKYIEQTTGLNISNKPVSLTLTYEKSDGTTGSEIITNNDGTSSTTPASDVTEIDDEDIVNPNTGDNINKYIIIGLLSLVGLIISITKEKQLFKTLVVIGLFATLAIPFGTKADTEAFIIKFTTNKVQNTSTELLSGPDLNLMMFKLCTGNDNLIKKYPISNDDYFYINNPDEPGHMNVSCNATHFVRATKEQYDAIKDSLTEKNIISISDVDLEAYMWYDESTTTLYYYSSAIALLLNEDSSAMFGSMENFTELDLSEFDTINVTDIKRMFSALHNVKAINLGNNFDTSKVTDMSEFCYECFRLQEIDLGDKFDTSNVTDMSDMFANASSLINLDLGDKFDTSKVTDMSDMFTLTTSLTSLNLGNKFDTSNVTNMNFMFAQTGLVELNLGNKFDTSKVTDMSYMFNESYHLKTIYTKYDFDFSSNPDVEEMFSYADSLVGGGGVTYYDHADYNNSKYARIAGGFFTFIPNDEETYSEIISGPELNLLMHKLSTGEDDLEMVIGENSWGNLDIHYEYNNNESDYWFNNYVEYIKYAPKGKYNDVKDNLTANNLISTPDSDYPSYMWFEPSSGTIYIYTEANQLLMSENASFMFANLSGLYDLDMSMFDTRNVTNMNGMFTQTESLSTLNLGNSYDTSKVTNMNSMFYYVPVEELHLGDKFDTSKVTNMSNMFGFMECLEVLDLGDKFDTSKVTDMSYMFTMMANLSKIYVSADFDLSSLENSNSMFEECTSIVGESGTEFNYDYMDATYARIDDPEHDRPGYFTLRQN
ncbi:MAG: BspA family leucine-rich repeat surface protein [Bacilli bacterium]|nr:BspA family leucine-rich repeat surface protein [Bacilli bacterium]